MLSLGPHARPSRHPPDDPNQYAVPGDGVPHGIFARPRHRRGPSGPRDFAPSQVPLAPRRRGHRESDDEVKAPEPLRPHHRRGHPFFAGKTIRRSRTACARTAFSRRARASTTCPGSTSPAMDSNGRSDRSASRTAPATWRAFMSTISRMSSGTASTPTSVSRATRKSSRPVRPASIRFSRRSKTRPPRWSKIMLDQITRDLLTQHHPDVVGLTIPFPGNVYGAFRMAQAIRKAAPQHENRHRRRLRQYRASRADEPRVFDYVDYVTLDDGEGPLLALLDHLRDASSRSFRTFLPRQRRSDIRFRSHAARHPLQGLRHADLRGPPTDHYFSLCELLNPMHRLWSDGRWNKLTSRTAATGKNAPSATLARLHRALRSSSGGSLVDRSMAQLATETGQTGFHFVDEAAPPKALDALAKRSSSASLRSPGGEISASKKPSPPRWSHHLRHPAASR